MCSAHCYNSFRYSSCSLSHSRLSHYRSYRSRFLSLLHSSFQLYCTLCRIAMGMHCSSMTPYNYYGCSGGSYMPSLSLYMTHFLPFHSSASLGRNIHYYRSHCIRTCCCLHSMHCNSLPQFPLCNCNLPYVHITSVPQSCSMYAQNPSHSYNTVFHHSLLMYPNTQ